MSTPAVLLAIVAVYSAAILWWGRTFRFELRTATVGHSRGAVLRGWAMGIAISFGLPASLGLTLLGLPPVWAEVPGPFLPLILRLGAGGWVLTPGPLLIGMAVGTGINALLVRWRVRAGRSPIRISRAPDIGAKSRDDVWPAVLLSISAGISEELYFRLFVPLLIALVSGSALFGFVVATALFGAAHRYQGPIGVIATMLVGALLAYIYLASGALWLAMLFHMVIDLNALVVRSGVTKAWR